MLEQMMFHGTMRIPVWSIARALIVGLLFLAAVQAQVLANADSSGRPNVILIAVDDMNDWIGPLNSAMAKTPNLDRLAIMGVTFQNAHTAGIYCAPSRSAIFTGRYATTTGCYSSELYFYDHPEIRPLQVAFKEAGYRTFGTGKLFHHPAGWVDLRGWDEFQVRTSEQKRLGWAMNSWEHGAPLPDPYPHSPYNQADPTWKGKPFMEVGPIPNDREEEMADTMRTNWACEILNRAHNSPFFLAVGFYAPHFPNYAPEKYFDLYPLDSIKRPAWKEDDLDDIPPIMRERHTVRKERIHNQLLKLGIVETTLQGYLACISYADAMVGRLLDSLAASRYRDDTIVVFWSDHGFTHGQKGHWGKHTLWERTSNVPFMWSGPRIPQGQTSNVTVSLVDIYPTLSEFCSLSPDPGLEGVSLVNTLKSLASAEDRYVLLPFDGPGSYAVISRNWRYIHYEDGTEELYDVVKDPNEWDNLAADARYARVKRKLESLGPDRFAPSATPASALRLVVEGETFRWVPKDPKKSEK